MDIKPRVIFFGSGPVAAQALELLTHHCSIEAVITKPKPSHHKADFPVLELAEKLSLPVITAADRHELSQVVSRTQFKSKLAVLIDFGIIVGQDVIDAFPLGIVNSHFSLLPQWRGADPITFSILSGQKETGVSLMLLVEAMDEGPLLAQGVYKIPLDTTTPQLTDGLVRLSDALLEDALPKHISGEIKPVAQEQAVKMMGKPFEPTYSRKLTKQDGLIDWQKPAAVIEREIRAYIEWPKSQTALGEVPVAITATTVIKTSGKPGSLAIDGKQLIVYCGQNALQIRKLKPSGKSEMPIEAFLAGYRAKLDV